MLPQGAAPPSTTPRAPTHATLMQSLPLGFHVGLTSRKRPRKPRTVDIWPLSQWSPSNNETRAWTDGSCVSPKLGSPSGARGSGRRSGKQNSWRFSNVMRAEGLRDGSAARLHNVDVNADTGISLRLRQQPCVGRRKSTRPPCLSFLPCDFLERSREQIGLFEGPTQTQCSPHPRS